MLTVSEVAESIPRTRGDEPCLCHSAALCAQVFPAPAGMNRGLEMSVFKPKSIPRTRGDEPKIMCRCGAPRRIPRTRGDEPPEDIEHLIVRRIPRTRGDEPW